MDIWPVIFALFLLLAGLLVAAAILSDRIRRPRPQGDPRSTRQQLAKAKRQMERRRGRIWWKVDEMYAEFVSRAGADPLAAAPPAAEGGRPAGGETGQTGGGEEFTLAGIQEAYEAFLRGGRPER